jgi:hypothetical protein
MKGAAVTLAQASIAGVNSLAHVEMRVQRDKATKALGDKPAPRAAFAALNREQGAAFVGATGEIT